MSRATDKIKEISGGVSARSGERPSREEAEEAVRTLIAWAGDDPKREDLIETPRRVVESYEEFFGGYRQDPQSYLAKNFNQVGSYQDMVMLRRIHLESHCEHHMAPFIGYAHLAYIPDKRFVGISKLARVVESLSRRLQNQERLTSEIHDAVATAIEPKGVAVLLETKHQCMTTRGVYKPDVVTATFQLSGLFKEDPRMEERFMKIARGDSSS